MLLTIVPQRQPNMDAAENVAQALQERNLIQEWRPAVAMGDGIEVMVEDAKAGLVKRAFREAGYLIVEEQI